MMMTLLCLAGYLFLPASNPIPQIISPPVSDSVRWERAIACIKYFEGWHTARNHPYIGWGHRLLPGEKLDSNLTKEQGDSLLREDLRKRYAVFRRFGKDALLLSEILDKISYPKLNIILRIKNLCLVNHYIIH